MAEFAAAASGAGLASLGVQCCNGLAEYYASYQTYDEQIGAAQEGIQVLTTTNFEVLERVISQYASDLAYEAAIRQVETILTLCKG